MEKRGIPAVLVVSTPFKSLALAQAAAFSLPNVALLVLPHPMGVSVAPETAALKAENAVEELITLMTNQGALQ
jgi:hypothetical protein